MLTSCQIAGSSNESTLGNRKKTAYLYYKFEYVVFKLSELFGKVAILTLIIMMLLVVSDVALRFFLNRPIQGSAEYAMNLMVGVGIFGFAWCALNNMHVKVEVVTERFSKKVQGILEIFNFVLLIPMCIIIGLQSISRGVFVKTLAVRSNITGVMSYPFYYLISIGYFLLALAAVILLIQSIFKVVKK